MKSNRYPYEALYFPYPKILIVHVKDNAWQYGVLWHHQYFSYWNQEKNLQFFIFMNQKRYSYFTMTLFSIGFIIVVGGSLCYQTFSVYVFLHFIDLWIDLFFRVFLHWFPQLVLASGWITGLRESLLTVQILLWKSLLAVLTSTLFSDWFVNMNLDFFETYDLLLTALNNISSSQGV